VKHPQLPTAIPGSNPDPYRHVPGWVWPLLLISNSDHLYNLAVMIIEHTHLYFG